MLQIEDALVSLDILERYFMCDLDACHGECCIEGDAGAPITSGEYEKLQELTPAVWDYLTPAAQRVLEEQGPAYYDEDGDLVTSIVDGRAKGVRAYQFLREPLVRRFGQKWYDELAAAAEAWLARNEA